MNEPHSGPRAPVDSRDALLPDDLLYAEDGHASDVVLTCLADDEGALVPEAVRAHVLACATCGASLGHAALLSLRADSEVRAYVASKALAARSAPSPQSPYRALALGFLVAVLSAAPRLAALPDEAARLARALLHGGPGFLRMLREIAWLGAHAARERGLAVSFATAFALVACAVWLARTRSRGRA